jgi:hypothetical protein
LAGIVVVLVGLVVVLEEEDLRVYVGSPQAEGLGGINERISQLKALRRRSRKKQVAYLTCPWSRRERGQGGFEGKGINNANEQLAVSHPAA